jgi:hypothetical protein
VEIASNTDSGESGDDQYSVFSNIGFVPLASSPIELLLALGM